MPHQVKITYMALGNLTPSEGNPKNHDVQAIRESIERFGFKGVIEWDERKGCIHSGHGRRKALLAIKESGDGAPDGIKVRSKDGEWMVPILRGYSTRSDAEFKALRIADNQTTIKGGWDDELLADDLRELSELNALDGVGMSSGEISKILGGSPADGADDLGDLDPLKYSVIVDFENEEEQVALLTELEERGYKCRLLIA